MSSTKREIILGVGGGIAAYKSCDLLRRLQDLDFAITVVPTPSSLNFVGSATWEALSGRSVTTEVWEKVEEVKVEEVKVEEEPVEEEQVTKNEPKKGGKKGKNKR